LLYIWCYSMTKHSKISKAHTHTHTHTHTARTSHSQLFTSMSSHVQMHHAEHTLPHTRALEHGAWLPQNITKHFTWCKSLTDTKASWPRLHKSAPIGTAVHLNDKPSHPTVCWLASQSAPLCSVRMRTVLLFPILFYERQRRTRKMF
jgi:hypothetical protein